jgi:SAM-dependent methyltransferase
MTDKSTQDTQPEVVASSVAADYDRVADEYAKYLYAELEGKPFDRELLDRFVSLVGDGRVCDVGCGPGHVTRYLHERGCDAFGVDLSARMVELATIRNPGVEFRVGDLRALPVDDGSLAGIVCFYSLIHLESDQLAPALARLRRSLRAGGRLLLAVHEGREIRQPGELWGIPVALRFHFFTYDQLTAALLEAGFTIEQITHRAPNPDVEVETDRLYASGIALPTWSIAPWSATPLPPRQPRLDTERHRCFLPGEVHRRLHPSARYCAGDRPLLLTAWRERLAATPGSDPRRSGGRPARRGHLGPGGAPDP